MQKESKLPSLPPAHELERVAQLANTTVPTVRKHLRGGTGKPRIAARIQAALIALGFATGGERSPQLVAAERP